MIDEKLTYLKMMRGSKLTDIFLREDNILQIGFDEFLLEVKIEDVHVAPILEKIPYDTDTE